MATTDVSDNPDIQLDQIRVDFDDERLRENLIAIEQSMIRIQDILTAIDARLKAGSL